MWYPGDTGGYATANVLLGRTDPAGRLPFTWPASLGQGVANQPASHPERTSNGVDASGNFCPALAARSAADRSAPPPIPKASTSATAGMTSST